MKLDNFIPLIQESFSFLVSEHGFHLADFDETSVRWDRGMYHVAISYYRYGFELDLHLCYNDGKDLSSYSLSEVRLLEQLADIEDNSYIYMASTPERLSLGISQIASLIKKICERFDIFNQEVFGMLATIRRKNSEEYAKEQALERMRNNAERAWKEKNFAAIKTLYEPFLDNLLKSEMKKYEYAVKRLENNPLPSDTHHDTIHH